MYRTVRHYSQVLSRDIILSNDNRQRTIKSLSTLKPLQLFAKGAKPKLKAAVLVPLCTFNNELSLLYTVRSMKLRNNRGQVAFPGGLFDDNDNNLQETALRETHEEIGIDRENIDVWGPGPPVGRPDMMVTPFLANLGEIDINALRVNPDEVERTFVLSLEKLCLPVHFRTTTFRTQVVNYTLPVFTVNDLRIWGLTALITHTILQCLLPAHYNNRVEHSLLSSQNLPSRKPL